MSAARIIADHNGRLFIDKRDLGVRIGLRVGAITQEQAEERLRVEMARIEYEQERKKHARPTFADCAARYVACEQVFCEARVSARRSRFVNLANDSAVAA